MVIDGERTIDVKREKKNDFGVEKYTYNKFRQMFYQCCAN